MSNLRFIVDRSLGKLAKWLRILGFDTIYAIHAEPGSLLSETSANRVIVTRTHRLRTAHTAGPLVFIESDHYVAQLQQLIQDLGLQLTDVKLFSRCLHCNKHIESIEKMSIFEKVPDYVWETHDQFNQCPSCRRIYWAGSHGIRTQKLIEELFGKDLGNQAR